MKKCSDCNIEMLEDTNLHTDYVGGTSFEERLYLTTYDRSVKTKNILGFETSKMETSRVKARVCPSCGKVELYIVKGEK